MKRLLGDDAENGGLTLGEHTFSDSLATVEVTGGYSRAIQTLRSFGPILAPRTSSPVPTGGGGSPKPHAPYERR